MKPTLLILAAGMASRYGSMKQTEGFGPSGETIMDYSIYDAIRAGFGKVVFIIRKDFAENFKNIFNKKLDGKIAVDYVYQDLKDFVDMEIPAGRTKPWGTGHAVLCAKNAIKEPFAVINADDFYGKDAFVKAANFLKNACNENTYAIVGYELAKTLSDYGTVSRGVCEVDDQHNLVSIKERTKVFREGNSIVYEENNISYQLPANSIASMNFWCFDPTVFNHKERLFPQFLKENIHDIKSEFFIPLTADDFVKNGGKIKVIPTSSQWFGVTYKEDAPNVKNNIDGLIATNEYPHSLWQSEFALKA